MKPWNCPVELQEISLNEAKDYIKKKYHIDVPVARLCRWIHRGLVSYDGRRIFLRARKRAGWVTCQMSIDKFVEKQGEQKQETTQDIKEEDNPDKLINLLRAQKYIKKTYQRDVTIPTLRNYCKRGFLSRSGRRYILESRRGSGLFRGRHTTTEHINQFICELDS